MVDARLALSLLHQLGQSQWLRGFGENGILEAPGTTLGFGHGQTPGFQWISRSYHGNIHDSAVVSLGIEIHGRPGTMGRTDLKGRRKNNARMKREHVIMMY